MKRPLKVWSEQSPVPLDHKIQFPSNNRSKAFASRRSRDPTTTSARRIRLRLTPILSHACAACLSDSGRRVFHNNASVSCRRAATSYTSGSGFPLETSSAETIAWNLWAAPSASRTTSMLGRGAAEAIAGAILVPAADVPTLKHQAEPRFLFRGSAADTALLWRLRFFRCVQELLRR